MALATRWLFYLVAAVEAVPLMEENACDLVTITHTNIPKTNASAVLAGYLATIEQHGGSSLNNMRKLIVEGTLGHELTHRLNGPAWDIFIMGGLFSYSVHCWRYVEMADARWNVLLCQQRHGHALGTPAVASQCMRGSSDGQTNYSNGTLASPPDAGAWLAGEATTLFYKNTGVDEAEEGKLRAARAQEAQEMVLHLPHAEQASDVAQHLQRRAEELWPGDPWNVLVEHISQTGLPNWNEDAKEQIHLTLQPGYPHLGYPLNVILFSRHCFHRPDDISDGADGSSSSRTPEDADALLAVLRANVLEGE